MKNWNGERLRQLMLGGNKSQICLSYRAMTKAAAKLGFKLSLSVLQNHMENKTEPSCRYLALYSEIFDEPMENFFSGQFHYTPKASVFAGKKGSKQ